MTSDAPAGRHSVRLVDVPVELYRRAQQHTDDLLRELVLMADHERASGAAGTATRLAATADDHRATHASLRLSAAEALAEARERGEEAVTLVYDVELGVADCTEAWGRLLGELAQLCRAGTLLSVPAADDVALFSAWFCTEFVRQLRDGAAPLPWPAYLASYAETA
jgi:hypothetical protein